MDKDKQSLGWVGTPSLSYSCPPHRLASQYCYCDTNQMDEIEASLATWLTLIQNERDQAQKKSQANIEMDEIEEPKFEKRQLRKRKKDQSQKRKQPQRSKKSKEEEEEESCGSTTVKLGQDHKYLKVVLVVINIGDFTSAVSFPIGIIFVEI